MGEQEGVGEAEAGGKLKAGQILYLDLNSCAVSSVCDIN